MVATRFTDLVGCELPVQLAAMGGVGTNRLAAAVVAAGGFGMVPHGTEPAKDACGLNYLVPFAPDPDVIEEAARTARVVEFFFGDPAAELIGPAHAGGALVGWQVGSVTEATAAAAAGCDYVVAQGIEAGGHVRGTLSLDELLPRVLEAVALPVIAAGGVATGERVVELLRSGAEGVRVGTRFIATPESGAHPEYIRSLLGATGADTVLTEWFNKGWAHAPHRVLRSSEAAARESGWRATMPPTAGADRQVVDMPMYAGMGVEHVTRMQPAADVVAELVSLL